MALLHDRRQHNLRFPRNVNLNVVRPYKTWGYPIVPALFIVAAAVLLYYTFTDNLRNSFAGVLIILAGVPVYWYFAKRRSATRTT